MARISGDSKTETFRPSVKLIASTSNPVGTLVSMWVGSRYKDTIDPDNIQSYYEGDRDDDIMKDVKQLLSDYPEYNGDAMKAITGVASMVVKSDLPPLDSLMFTFEIDDANVAWREQLVRGRLPQNFWMQTSRTADLSKIDVNMSENIKYYGGDEAVKVYKDTVDSIRNAYSILEGLGVPVEDIRLTPQGMLHRVYWMVGYRTLKSTLSKRTSWIAQSTLWSPIIYDIQHDLRKYCDLLANYLGVPSDVKISNGKVIDHTYDNENYDRYTGKDPQPTDPLWLAYHGYKMPSHTDIKFYDRMKSYYINLWNDETLSILGWDRFDPSKLGPYDRPE
jgi:hypothetical protein